MKSPLPVALGCISLLLCLLKLPGCRPLPAGRALMLPKHREPPDRRPAAPLRRRTETLPWLGTAKAQLDSEQPGGALLQRPLAGPHRSAPAPWRGSGLAAQHRQTGPQRAKRHAAPRRHRAQLMRVGCVLGTCQVQNLGHRLWQLMGQSGRQDSSPMNPSSPHSYG
ncbi:protein ADM2 [Emydura macquarii macquarii]|uniref:protein ADM2 n=1 Tax=Emydura macquarii macquarii TaxID=1129001 RepID=UPI00352AB749